MKTPFVSWTDLKASTGTVTTDCRKLSLGKSRPRLSGESALEATREAVKTLDVVANRLHVLQEHRSGLVVSLTRYR